MLTQNAVDDLDQCLILKDKINKTIVNEVWQ